MGRYHRRLDSNSRRSLLRLRPCEKTWRGSSSWTSKTCPTSCAFGRRQNPFLGCVQLNEQLPAPVPQTKKFHIAFTQCNNKSKRRCRLQTSQVAFQPLRRPAFLSIGKNKNELGPKPVLQQAKAVFAKGPLHGR